MRIVTTDILGFDLDLHFRKEHMKLVRKSHNDHRLQYVPLTEDEFCKLQNEMTIPFPLSIRTHCDISHIHEDKQGKDRYELLISGYATKHGPDQADKYEGRRKAAVNARCQWYKITIEYEQMQELCQRVIAEINKSDPKHQDKQIAVNIRKTVHEQILELSKKYKAVVRGEGMTPEDTLRVLQQLDKKVQAEAYTK